MEYLKDLIQLRYRKEVSTPPLSDTRLLRASSFATICPREEVLAAIHNVIRKETLEADALLNFTLGTDFHSLLQDEILPKTKTIIGEWECKGCTAHFGGARKNQNFTILKMLPRPDKCTKCKGVEFRYVEQYFKNVEYGITGHPDGFILLEGRQGPGVIEAKSISHKGASEIKQMPKFEHIVQAQIYMWFTGLQWACLFYWDKGAYGLEAITEHYIDRDEETIQLVKDTLLAIKSGISGGKLPDRLCPSRLFPRAVECDLIDLCFKNEGKNDGTT